MHKADYMDLWDYKADKFFPVIHKKTGNIYLALGCIINATNALDGQKLMLYVNGEGMTFVREYEEFWEKFERYTGDSSREEKIQTLG